MSKEGLSLILLGGSILGLVGGCSASPTTQAENATKQNAPAGRPADPPRGAARSMPQEKSTGVPVAGASRVIGKRDVTIKGNPSCRIDFVYADFEPEDLYWNGEPCASITAELVDQGELQRLGIWQRLDDFAKRHVSEMPGGRVLYVEGNFTASLYPVGTTRLSYEVRVAE